MDLERLRYFRTVIEAEGLSRAAGLLAMTPGALSKAIRQLEDELGHPLFVRAARRLHPNAAARRLYDASGRIFDEVARARAALEETAGVPESLRIASFEVFTTYVMAELIEGEALGPGLQVLDLPTRQIEAAVLDGRADLGLTYVPYPQPGLGFEPVAELPFGIYAAAEAFAGVGSGAIPFAVPVGSIAPGPSGLVAVDGWPAGFPRQVAYRLSMLQTALELAARGACAVFVPDVVARLHNRRVRPEARLTRRRAPPRFPAVRETAYRVTRVEDQDDPRWPRIHAALAAILRGGS